MARARSLNAFVAIDNVEPTLALMRKYGRSFENDVRDNVRDNVSPLVARLVRIDMMGGAGQARAVAPTVISTRDRLPALKAFGAKRVASTGVRAGDIGFGGNFGGGNRVGTVNGVSPLGKAYTFQRHVTRQFGAWKGRGNDHIYGTFSRNSAKINELWQKTLDDVYLAWTKR